MVALFLGLFASAVSQKKRPVAGHRERASVGVEAVCLFVAIGHFVQFGCAVFQLHLDAALHL